MIFSYQLLHITVYHIIIHNKNIKTTQMLIQQD